MGFIHNFLEARYVKVPHHDRNSRIRIGADRVHGTLDGVGGIGRPKDLFQLILRYAFIGLPN